jgi:Ca2+-binding RTX toxin-like protein
VAVSGSGQTQSRKNEEASMRGTTQYHRWLRRAALLATASAALAAPQVASATDIGQAGYGPNSGCTGSVQWLSSASVPAGGGVITAFRYKASGDGTSGTGPFHVDFNVLRSVGGTQYLVVGHAGAQTDAEDGAVHSVAVNIPVQAGDVLGLWTDEGNWPCSIAGSGSDVFANFASDPPTGSIVDLPINAGPGTLNVAATVGPAGPTCNGKTPTINFAGNNAPHVINGTPGNDVIYSGNGADTIDGVGGNDTICGVGGADKIRGGAGDDYVFGGPGDDDLGGQVGTDSVIGGQGNDRVNGAEGNDFVAGGDGNDIANGGDGDDRVHGGANDDVLAGNAGIDECVGNQGNDRTTLNGGCEDFQSTTVSNNTPATTAAGDRAVVASAEDPDEAAGNAATLMPAADAGSGLDVDGGNSTAFGDGV